MLDEDEDDVVVVDADDDADTTPRAIVGVAVHRCDDGHVVEK
jgi:hypothetical protein